MIRRLYIHNFRCLENFDLPIAGRSSVLLIGKNGAGKTSVAKALKVLQNIARGTNRVKDLVEPQDFARGRTDQAIRIEIEVELKSKTYGYDIAFELSKGFKELRVVEESLRIDGKPVYTRELAKVKLAKTPQDKEASFFIDWHLVALPIVWQQASDDPLRPFKDWLGKMLILRPIPSLINGDSSDETLQPTETLSDYGAWFSGLLAYAPSAYARIDTYLKEVMPDMKDIKNPSTGTDARSLTVQFDSDRGSLHVPFKELSDGEKCFMICALVLAASDAYGSLFCFWDEPDNYLSLSEVGHFIMSLRRAFQSGGQFIATSHNSEAIRKFSDENTLVLERRSHLDPTIVRQLSEFPQHGDLISAMTRGDI